MIENKRRKKRAKRLQLSDEERVRLAWRGIERLSVEVTWRRLSYQYTECQAISWRASAGSSSSTEFSVFHYPGKHGRRRVSCKERIKIRLNTEGAETKSTEGTENR